MVKWSTCEKVMMLRFEPKWLLKPSRVKEPWLNCQADLGFIPIRFANGEKQISRIPPGGTLKLIGMKIFNPKKFKKQIKEIIKLEVIPAY